MVFSIQNHWPETPYWGHHADPLYINTDVNHEFIHDALTLVREHPDFKALASKACYRPTEKAYSDIFGKDAFD